MDNTKQMNVDMYVQSHMQLLNAIVSRGYRSGNFLYKKIKTDNAIVGGSVTFLRDCKFTASDPQSETTSDTINDPEVTAYMKERNVKAFVKGFDRREMDWKHVDQAVESMGTAIGYQTDNAIIDACAEAALPDSNKIGADVGGVGGKDSGMNIIKVAEVRKVLLAAGFELKDCVFVIGAEQDIDMLTIPGVQQSNYMNDGMFLGLSFIVRGDDIDKGGLPVSGGVKDCFAFHKDAIGLGIEDNWFDKIKAGYFAVYQSSIASIRYESGAVVIDPAGIVKISCTESD